MPDARNKYPEPEDNEDGLLVSPGFWIGLLVSCLLWAWAFS